MKNPDQPSPYPPQGQPPQYAQPPAGAAYPQPAGYAQPGQQTVIIQATGNCPNCHVGHLIETYSLCGILWLILCFPCGLICFLSMKDKKCGQCGYEVHDS